MSRAYEPYEVRALFLEHVATIVLGVQADYKNDVIGDHDIGKQVAFQILETLDGLSLGKHGDRLYAMPDFSCVAQPRKDAQAFRASRGENWFPKPPQRSSDDISGELSDRFFAILNHVAAGNVSDVENPPVYGGAK